MKLGFIAYFNEDAANFAGKAGFECLECFADRGTALDLDRLTPAGLDSIMKLMVHNRLIFSSISCNVCHLAGDDGLREKNTAYFRKAIERCRDFGTDLVVTNALCDTAVSMETNLEMYKRVFSDYAELAERLNIKIAIENCPHFLGNNPYTIGNLGYSPEMFDAMFNAVPSKTVGIEFDPSHLLWEQIDYLDMLRRYINRVYAFHAKDAEIMPEELKKYGIFGQQLGKTKPYDMGWWRYRIPGFGQIDFRAIFDILHQSGYAGNVVIEHEDPVFGAGRSEEGNDIAVIQEGLTAGLKYLKTVIY